MSDRCKKLDKLTCETLFRAIQNEIKNVDVELDNIRGSYRTNVNVIKEILRKEYRHVPEHLDPEYAKELLQRENIKNKKLSERLESYRSRLLYAADKLSNCPCKEL